jgi:ribonuclease VapC
MVIDTSALLAVFFNESYGSSIAKILKDHAAELRMSTVNLTETLILIQDRQPQLYEGMRTMLLTSSIRFVPPDKNQAEIAADARIRLPLNLGDCFAYALAKSENCRILTLDDDFKNTDVTMVKIPK